MNDEEQTLLGLSLSAKMTEETARELVGDIRATWPDLTFRQAAVLAAATVSPTVPGAAQAASMSHVTVYGWLGRFPAQQHRANETFQAAWPVCKAMGEENYVMRALRLSEDRTEKGAAAAPGVMARILGGYDPRFSGHTAAVSLDGQKVKRIILEREGEEEKQT
jgi:hypothetical protein